MLLSRRWSKVDNRSVRSHQKLVDAINQVADPRQVGVSTIATPGGTTKIPIDQRDFWEFRLVVIKSAGPDAEADYTDARYWGQFCEINDGDEVSQIGITLTDPVEVDEGIFAEPGTITFTNIPEIKESSHLMVADDQQPIWVSRIVGPDGVGHWYSNVSPPASASFYGKVAAWTAGTNTVTLTPCEEDGTATGAANVDVSITLPTTRTVCSFAYMAVDEVLVYFIKGSKKWLASVPMAFSTDTKKVYQITGGSGTGGFDNVRIIS